jgi:hypothetical protein
MSSQHFVLICVIYIINMQCQCLTVKGIRCSRKAIVGNLCKQHAEQPCTKFASSVPKTSIQIRPAIEPEFSHIRPTSPIKSKLKHLDHMSNFDYSKLPEEILVSILERSSYVDMLHVCMTTTRINNVCKTYPKLKDKYNAVLALAKIFKQNSAAALKMLVEAVGTENIDEIELYVEINPKQRGKIIDLASSNGNTKLIKMFLTPDVKLRPWNLVIAIGGKSPEIVEIFIKHVPIKSELPMAYALHAYAAVDNIDRPNVFKIIKLLMDNKVGSLNEALSTASRLGLPDIVELLQMAQNSVN